MVKGEGQGLVSRLLMGIVSLLFLAPTDLAYSPLHNENGSALISQHELHGHQQNLLPLAA